MFVIKYENEEQHKEKSFFTLKTLEILFLPFIFSFILLLNYIFNYHLLFEKINQFSNFLFFYFMFINNFF